MTGIYRIEGGDFVELTEAEWLASPQLTRREKGVKLLLTPEEAAEHLEREANPPAVTKKKPAIDIVAENKALRAELERTQEAFAEMQAAFDDTLTAVEDLKQRVTQEIGS